VKCSKHRETLSDMRLDLSDKQSFAFESPATEILYGGAAGGGKSYFLRAMALVYALDVPGIQIYLFRRTLPDLRSNHLRGPTSFHVLLAEHIAGGTCSWKSQENEFVFSNLYQQSPEVRCQQHFKQLGMESFKASWSRPRERRPRAQNTIRQDDRRTWQHQFGSIIVTVWLVGRAALHPISGNSGSWTSIA
jgi:hypothetical protein